MVTVQQLLDAAKVVGGLPSFYRLARVLGVSDVTVGNWRHGRSVPDDATAVRLAELAGMDAAEVLASMHAQRASGTELAAVWERLAKRAQAAAFAVVAVLGAVGGPPDAGAATLPAADGRPHSLYIMSNTLSAWLRRIAAFISWPGIETGNGLRPA